MVKGVIRGEKGAALVVALILLLVGGLLAASLLRYMGTGILVGEVYETRTAELYAADAGVEDAIWKIQHNEGNLPCNPGHSWSYNISEVNGKRVEVTIEYVGEGVYKIDSIGVTIDANNTAAIDSSTTVEAYVTPLSGNYSSITDHILTSQDELEWAKKVKLIWTEGHEPEADYAGPWPTPGELGGFYGRDVEGATHYYGDTEIDLEGNSCPPGPIYVNNQESNSWSSGLGPLYVEGRLKIENGGDPATLTLNGTIYVTGDTLIGTTEKDFTLDLNGQTIFVSSSTAGNQKAISIGDRCTVRGPGAIIAVGDVYFAPKGEGGGNGEPVFIFSVRGTTQLQPSGVFYGAIAGSLLVDVQPGNEPTITYPIGGFGDDDLNFPGFGGAELAYNVASWEIKQQ